eukprot:COSAG01_NODE_451_length_16883_cov_55.881733_11_plen_178_part_00
MEPFTLTQNPQPAAPNPIGIGCWLVVSVSNALTCASHGLAKYTILLRSEDLRYNSGCRQAGRCCHRPGEASSCVLAVPLQAPTGPPACVHARGVKPGPTVPELLGHTSGADSWHARRNTLRQDGLARTSSNLSQMEALATSLRVTTGRRPRTAQTPRYGHRQWPGRSSGSLPCPGGR